MVGSKIDVESIALALKSYRHETASRLRHRLQEHLRYRVFGVARTASCLDIHLFVPCLRAESLSINFSTCDLPLASTVIGSPRLRRPFTSFCGTTIYHSIKTPRNDRTYGGSRERAFGPRSSLSSSKSARLPPGAQYGLTRESLPR